MTAKFENGLFIFRRDLRIIDNITLNNLNEYCKNIYAIFIFTPEQVGSANDFKSNNAIQFMIESLEDLAKNISKMGGRLYTFYGHNNKIIADCIKDWNIQAIGFNLDITPFARERDSEIIKLCDKLGVVPICDYDYYLHQPGIIMNGSGQPYQKFTPYYNSAKKHKVHPPTKLRRIHFRQKDSRIQNKITIAEAFRKFAKVNPDILVHGGRDNAIKQMRAASRNIKHYSRTHDELSKPTSQLSAYIKFGNISIREVYNAFRSNTDFIRQLYWRDFYASVLYFFPHTLDHALKPQYNKIHWHYNDRWFDAWKTGHTGFPIVDAAMRQLNATGYMHNRGRLIVGSFLVKTLLISWEKGSQYFSQKLTDYDPASNQLNWQWVASSGPDSQPYFRIFNPWMQQEEHDNECEYIKKWVPELYELPPKIIHNWETMWSKYKNIDYPKPICDYKEQKEKALKMYKDALY